MSSNTKKILVLVVAALLILAACGRADDLNDYQHIVTGLSDGETMTRKLLIGDDVKVQFFFATATAPETVMIDGSELPVCTAADGRFTVVSPGMKITELDKSLIFDFGSIHVETSALAYIKAVRDSDKSAEVKAMVEALYEQFLIQRDNK